MSRFFTLLLLACIAIAASQSSPMLYGEVVDENPEGNAIPPTTLKYTNMFKSNFTVTVFGVPATTGGGQKDLKQLGRFLLKRMNAFQLKQEKNAGTNFGTYPDLLVYDIEVLQQYINSNYTSTGGEIWYNVLPVQASYVCVGTSCPAGASAISVTQSTRKLTTRQIQAAGAVANDVKDRLLSGGQDYFAKIQCVRIVNNGSSGCTGMPVVRNNPAATAA